MCFWLCLLISEFSCKKVINLVCLENIDILFGFEFIKWFFVNELIRGF